ncbi:growth arrest-specific 1 [Sarotherodon galilaeus]
MDPAALSGESDLARIQRLMDWVTHTTNARAKVVGLKAIEAILGGNPYLCQLKGVTDLISELHKAREAVQAREVADSALQQRTTTVPKQPSQLHPPEVLPCPSEPSAVGKQRSRRRRFTPQPDSGTTVRPAVVSSKDPGASETVFSGAVHGESRDSTRRLPTFVVTDLSQVGIFKTSITVTDCVSSIPPPTPVSLQPVHQPLASSLAQPASIPLARSPAPSILEAMSVPPILNPVPSTHLKRRDKPIKTTAVSQKLANLETVTRPRASPEAEFLPSADSGPLEAKTPAKNCTVPVLPGQSQCPAWFQLPVSLPEVFAPAGPDLSLPEARVPAGPDLSLPEARVPAGSDLFLPEARAPAGSDLFLPEARAPAGSALCYPEAHVPAGSALRVFGAPVPTGFWTVFAGGPEEPIQPPASSAGGPEEPVQPPASSAGGPEEPPPASSAGGPEEPVQPQDSSAGGSGEPSQLPASSAGGPEEPVQPSAPLFILAACSSLFILASCSSLFILASCSSLFILASCSSRFILASCSVACSSLCFSSAWPGLCFSSAWPGLCFSSAWPGLCFSSTLAVAWFCLGVFVCSDARSSSRFSFAWSSLIGFGIACTFCISFVFAWSSFSLGFSLRLVWSSLHLSFISSVWSSLRLLFSLACSSLLISLRFNCSIHITACSIHITACSIHAAVRFRLCVFIHVWSSFISALVWPSFISALVWPSLRLSFTHAVVWSSLRLSFTWSSSRISCLILVRSPTAASTSSVICQAACWAFSPLGTTS